MKPAVLGFVYKELEMITPPPFIPEFIVSYQLPTRINQMK